jgi:DNA-binding NtrC family response regulator
MVEASDKLRGKVVWVMDDNSDTRYTTGLVLKKQGATIREFENPDALFAALAEADKSRPDLLIADAGYDVGMEAIINRVRSGNPAMPVIVHTGDAELTVHIPGVQVVVKMGSLDRIVAAASSALQITNGTERARG